MRRKFNHKEKVLKHFAKQCRKCIDDSFVILYELSPKAHKKEIYPNQYKIKLKFKHSKRDLNIIRYILEQKNTHSTYLQVSELFGLPKDEALEFTETYGHKK